MNTHTPGPWEIKLSRDDEGTLCHIGTPDKIARCGQHVCQINGWGFDYDADKEQQANARLIAAAPDLLAACKRISEAFKNAPHETQNAYQGIWTDIDNAIAKVESTA